MKKESGIPAADFMKLSYKIRDSFYKPVNVFKTSIFLCGAQLNQTGKVRYKIAEAFNDWMYSYNYDVIFPEDIFEELLFTSRGRDLLSLENMLAESIDVIIIIPESPGSFAELGAFANDEKLREKIICLIDQKYKKDKSFINQGPVRLIKNVNKHSVIFIDPDFIEKNIAEIHSSIRRIKKTSIKSTEKISLLQLDNFLLPTIFLFEPVTKNVLTKFVETVNNDYSNSFQATTTSLTILTKKKFIELTTLGYKLTKLGVEHYFNLKRTSKRIKTQQETVAIDNMRLEILNFKLRNKKMKI